jgi:hypothetical protein
MLHSAKKRLPTTRRYNLSLPQRSVLQELRARPNLIIYPTDTNLGPYIMDRLKYIHAMLSAEHLSNTDNYEQIHNAHVIGETTTTLHGYLPKTPPQPPYTGRGNLFQACYPRRLPTINPRAPALRPM